MQRTVKAAFFNHFGSMTADELLAMPSDQVVALRNHITDDRNKEDGLKSLCMSCGAPLYIRYAADGKPLFAHYDNPMAYGCPWFTSKNANPDNLKAQQYHGQQESELHRSMCELIGDLAGQDARCGKVAIDEWLTLTNDGIRRKPDVLVEWRVIGRFAVEFQYSQTYQTEISGRSSDYSAVGIPLLWVLPWFDPNQVAEYKNDIASRHRGNIFVLDKAAVDASRDAQTLVLNCYLRRGETFEPPKLVRFDELEIPDQGLPYYKDRFAEPILKMAQDARRPYFPLLSDKDRRWKTAALGLPGADKINQKDRRRSVNWLLALSFDIVGVASGRPQRYTYEVPEGTEPGKEDLSKLSWRLNMYLETGKSHGVARCARLLEKLISRTTISESLKPTVYDKLRRAKSVIEDDKQVNEGDLEWRLLASLFPEVLDDRTHYLLGKSGSLPRWAKKAQID